MPGWLSAGLLVLAQAWSQAPGIQPCSDVAPFSTGSLHGDFLPLLLPTFSLFLSNQSINQSIKKSLTGKIEWKSYIQKNNPGLSDLPLPLLSLINILGQCIVTRYHSLSKWVKKTFWELWSTNVLWCYLIAIFVVICSRLIWLGEAWSPLE